ncbi:hypothetical protein SESBI_36171 [Sesbania bispinosa]|nr:hypothetical protein SESBI_36171 [Sesbania bispinosa]
MVQGKVERLGFRESLRMEEKALRASKESPLRARSAITEFQLETLLLSTYLPNMLVRFADLVHAVAVECPRFPSCATPRPRPIDVILNINEIIVRCCGF